MNKQAVAAELQTLLREPVKTDAPMSRLTTWNIGGPADFLVYPSSEDELAAVLVYLAAQHIPWLVIGNGSNLLVGDLGLRGVVIKMGEPFAGAQWRGLTVEASAGLLVGALALEAAERGAAGLEFARGIPGSVGGAVRMNAGAYGGFIGQFVTAIHAVDYEGQKLMLTREQIEFGYRDSSLFRLPAIISRVILALDPGDREQSLAKIKEYQQKRSLSQPLEFPSCGSVFRNPANDYAGRLIQLAGLQGLQIGGVAVSQKHGNFFINMGGATAADARELIAEVQRQVYEYSGIHLEPEVKMVGEFGGAADESENSAGQ
ncbi:MAG: UDP-N-acetylmuramate dehydrogenase [Clostridia bacterium]|nr:UDP-N-acetylmuramate dehydrogenase [Clostridia bacterium]